MMSTEQFLSGVHAVILDAGLGKARARILRKRLEDKGGEVLSNVSTAATHILVGKNVRRSRLPGLLGCEIPSGVRVLHGDWLSSCLVAGECVSEREYEVPVDSASSSPCKEEDKKEAPLATSRPHEKKKAPATETTESEGGEERRGEQEKCESVQKREETTTTEGETTEEEEKVESKDLLPDRFPTSSGRWKSDTTSPRKKTRLPSPDPDSDYVDSGEEEEGEERRLAEVDISALPPPSKRKRRWRCEVPPSEVQSWVNHNKYITDKLEELLAVYQSSPDDKWRAMSTTKVIQAVKKHPKEITCYEDALEVPFVGKRLAQKIDEIIASGSLRRLETVDKEKQAVLSAFAKIHGVGQVLAEQFYAQGYRTVDELAGSGVLNRQQRIGVKHYRDFQERMAREEVAEIEQKVRELAQLINSGLEVVTCGSYRRGKPTCGDVDILVTHGDGCSHRGVLPSLVQEGRQCGFLTDDLSIHHDQNGGGKYLGVCRLPGPDRKYRRIDIYVTPYSQFPCMLLHFTGSGHFNRSIRSKADKLNGVKIFEGTPVPVFSERDVFKYLDLPYREPTERDWD